MIHLKSTLAVSAIMLTGLVAASPFPYRSDEQPRRPRAVASLQAEASTLPAAMTTWANPPAKALAPAGSPPQVTIAAMPAPAFEPTAMIAPAAVPPFRHVSLLGQAQSKTDQVRRRKAVKAARERQIAAGQPAPDAQVAARNTSGTPQRIDPIGDILRGLGIGRES